MREIKFRAWDIKRTSMYLLAGIQFIRRTPRASLYSDVDGLYWKVNVSDIKLMQYTGQKDKNGVEIYEGDIVKTRHKTTYPFEVYWDDRDNAWRMRVNGELQFDKTAGLMFAKFGEVIGNIYEKEANHANS